MATTYTYSISVDFPLGFNSYILQNEIIDSTIVTILSDGISVSADVVSVTFESTLSAPDIVTLDTVVAAHSYSEPSLQEIPVGPNGGYTTLKDAIAQEGSNKLYILEANHIFVEDNPVTIPENSTVRGGGVFSTIVEPNNVNADVFVIDANCTVKQLSIRGATGASARGIYHNSTTVNTNYLININFEDCYKAICIDGSAGTSHISHCSISSNVNTVNIGIEQNDSKLHISSTDIFGKVANHIGYGIFSKGSNCVLTGNQVEIELCDVAICMDDDSQLLGTNYRLNACDTALEIGPTGTNTKINAGDLFCTDSTNWDLSVMASEAFIHVNSGTMTETKINNPNGVDLTLTFDVNLGEKNYQIITGERRFGLKNEQGKASFGEGMYSNTGQAVLSNSNLEVGTWVDNSVASLTDDTYFELFQAVGVGNCAYIGADDEFSGFKINVDVATTLVALTDVVIERWDGSAWIICDVMASNVKPPFDQYDKAVLATDKKQHVQLNIGPDTSYTKKVLNSLDRYWIRFRIAVAITGIPSVEYIRIHTNSTKFYKDGFMESFGNSRSWMFMPVSLSDFRSVTAIPSQSIYLSQNLNVGLTANNFVTGVDHSIGLTQIVPVNTDISWPFKLELRYIGSTAVSGNVRWIIRWGSANVGDAVFLTSGAAPVTGPNELTATTDVTVASTNTVIRTTQYISVCNFFFNKSNELGDTFFLNIQRNGANAADNYTGDVSLFSVSISYMRNYEAGHIKNYE